MVIDKLEKEDATYAPVKAAGTNITFGVEGNSIIIDATEHWSAEQSVVNVYTRGAGQPLTLDAADGDSGIYNVATIVIPPKKSELVEAGTQVNEQTGKEETVIKIETLPLDMDAVQVTLWPLPFSITAPEQQDSTVGKTAETVEEEA
nr:hypothetical protein [Mitsuokella multacida]